MKIPKELPIMGKYHTMNIIDDPNNDDCGEFDGDEVITINLAKNNEDELIHSLIHEIGHAMFVRTGLRQGLPIAIEEVIVQNYATVITELFNLKFKNKKEIGVPKV
jgi:Zn-dependent peptidase ImmA (M78 family)